MPSERIHQSLLLLSRCTGSASRIASYTRSNGPRRMATEASSSSFKAHSSTSKNAQILTSTILNRSPLLTRTLDPFEEAYYAYQRRLYRALSQTLPANVYFKPGSLLQRRVAIEELAREKEAFGEDWEPLRGLRVEEDDVAGGEGEGASGIGTKSFAQQMAEEAELDEKPQPRIHRADVEGDVKSLDRLSERNLYLIVMQNNVWTFPTGSAETEQVPLHKTALQRLLDSCGGGMDIWLVGRQPIGLYLNEAATLSKTFFFKGHILAGQCQPVVAVGIQDFAWLAKEEIQSRVDDQYWEGVKSMLSDY